MATRDFILEIGCEELPSAPLNKAIVQFKKLFSDGLDDQGLSHGEVVVLSSPRRLTVVAKDVAEATEEVHQIMRGPAAAIAFDAEGNPTKAAQGFARGRGLSADELIVKADKDGKEYVFAEVFVAARDAKEILVALAEKTIGDISWPRSQRWGTNSAKFVRPIRWICCLFGTEPLSVSYADVVSGTTTQGHRVLAPGAHEVADAASYVSTCEMPMSCFKTSAARLF